MNTDIVLTASTASQGINPALSSFAGIIGYLLLAFFLGKVFEKAGEPLWKAFVPVYNGIVLLRLVGFSGWFILLYLVPIVNIVLHVIVALRLGKAFSKSTVFSIFLLWLFSLIGYIIVGFDDSRYDKARATA